MLSIFRNNFLNRYPIEKAMREFGHRFGTDSRILDIGCGYKPYAKYFRGEYVGVDHDKENSKADVVCNSANIPLDASLFDAIVMNQTLEHTENVAGTIVEIKRLLKPDGMVFVSVPLVMKIHSIPRPSSLAPYDNFDKEKITNWNVDYWRFTKFGLISLFRDWQILSLTETSGYAGTLAQLINYFFSSFGLPYLFVPVYLINNLAGWWFDKIIKAACLGSKNRLVLKFYNLIYLSLPLNYILIIRKR